MIARPDLYPIATAGREQEQKTIVLWRRSAMIAALEGAANMPAYLVRLIDTRDLVGFYFADEPHDLLTIIDECTEAADCEYTELPDGGISWESPAIPVPIKIEKDDPDDSEDIPQMPWSGASLSESWWSVLYGYTDEQWTPFFPDAPREPRPPAPRRPLGPGRVVKFRKRGA